VSELQKIRLYLNFDMIASPNFVYAIYDGDGSAFGTSGPPGSGEVEKLFEDYLTNDAGLPHIPSEFDGRSDYGPFLDAGIASGGLDAGADGTKTVEEQALFGGTAGITYDENYHSAKDTVSNLNLGAWIQNVKGVAHAVATYGTSWAGFPPNQVTLKKRDTAAAAARLRSGGKYQY
jgi:carboxypeptidase Q